MKKVLIPTLLATFILASSWVRATNPIPESFKKEKLASDLGQDIKQTVRNFYQTANKRLRVYKRYALGMTKKAKKLLFGWLGSAGLSLTSLFLAVGVSFFFISEWLIIFYLGFLLLSLFFSVVSLGFFVLWLIELTRESSDNTPVKPPTPEDLEAEKRKKRRKKKRSRS